MAHPTQTDRYPTLTDDERDQVAAVEADLADIDAKINALADQRSALQARRRKVFEQAALRDATPEAVALTYRTTGQGYDDLRAIVRDLHPYLYDVAQYRGGDWSADARLVLGATLALLGARNAADQVQPVADALLRFAALCAPDGGLTFDTTKVPFHEVDHQWVEHAQGLHPVDIVEDDCGETRSLLLAHSADGDRAVLMDQRNGWRHEPHGLVATGTLIEVLTELFRIVREEQPTRDEDDQW